MNFAQQQLLKFGWKEGEGLGKNNQGIVNPLKANLKFDSTGFGHDIASDIKNNWWERVYNDAASNVVVDNNKDNVAVNVIEADGVEITTNNYSVKKLRKINGDSGQIYKNNFIKVSTLTNRGNIQEDGVQDAMEDIEMGKVKVLTDEELFKACGGRTAHKGARHGLKQTGKLARLAEQDRHLINSLHSQPGATPSDLLKQWTTVKSKKGKRKQRLLKKHREDAPEELSEMIDNECDYSTTRNKKKKKLKKNIEEAISAGFLALGTCSDEDMLGNNNSLASTSTESKTKRKKKKKKNHRDDESKILPPAPPPSPKRPLKRKPDFSSYRGVMDSGESSNEETSILDTDNFDDMVPVSEKCFQLSHEPRSKKRRKIDSNSDDLTEFEKKHLANAKKAKRYNEGEGGKKQGKSKKIKKRDLHVSRSLSKNIKDVVVLQENDDE